MWHPPYVFETPEQKEANYEFTIQACYHSSDGGFTGDSGRGGMTMESILEHLFQGDIIFPQSSEEERRFAALGDDVQEKKAQIEALLESDSLQAVKDYLELLDQFHDWERLLCYENGFLTATALCLEVWDRLEGLTQ